MTRIALSLPIAFCFFAAVAAAFPRFYGVMYTTWQNRYDRLEAFAECVKKEWEINCQGMKLSR